MNSLCISLLSRCVRVVPIRFLAAPSSKVVPVKEHKAFIEENASRIACNVCINFYLQGEEPGPVIKPDCEYPQWLFQLNLEPAMELEDLQPDNWLYWRALRKRQIEQNRRIQKLKTRFLHLQNSPSMKK